jgi:hypothetical protein
MEEILKSLKRRTSFWKLGQIFMLEKGSRGSLGFSLFFFFVPITRATTISFVPRHLKNMERPLARPFSYIQFIPTILTLDEISR